LAARRWHRRIRCIALRTNCPDCGKLITLSKETDDSVMRRALKTAREIRAAKEAELVAKIYVGEASAPPRETP